MKSRLAAAPRASEPPSRHGFRQHGAIACLAAVVMVALANLAIIGTSDRQHDEARVADMTVATQVSAARATLDRQRRVLDQLAALGATATDAAAEQFLARVPTLATGIVDAALADAGGTVQLGGAGIDDAVLGALAGDAAKEAQARPDTALLVTQTLRDGDTDVVGFARAWHDSDGRLGGIALIVVEANAFAGLDLARTDGSPLFGNAAWHAATLVALGEGSLMLRLPVPPAGLLPVGVWPFVAIALIGAAGLLGLVALFAGRLAATEQSVARLTTVERGLRAELAEATADADRSDEANRDKAQFFAQVTHELRTPLNAILGFSETIRQEMFGPVANPRYLEYAGLINEAGSHLLSLINDLLDEARIDSGKMEIAPIRVAAPALARSALDLVGLLAEGRDLAVTTTGLSSCPDLNIDPRAMKQVLVNLLANAIKYTPPGGRIDLRFAARDNGGAMIAISDTGIGMSAEDLRVAFEPFARANAREARRQQGTGLGLSLARALVRLHGGELTLASELDTGTVATITLPANAVFAARDERVAEPAQAA